MKVSELVSALRTSGESLKIELRVGPFEVGEVHVKDGQAWHAEVPGSSGFPALAMLARLTGFEARFGAQVGPERTIASAHQPPLEVVDDETRRAVAKGRAAGKLVVGVAERVSHRSVTALSLPPDVVPTSGEFTLSGTTPSDRAATEQFEQTFRQGTQAYLRHDFQQALEAFEHCLRLRPGDRRVLHNLERLRSRTT